MVGLLAVNMGWGLSGAISSAWGQQAPSETADQEPFLIPPAPAEEPMPSTDEPMPSTEQEGAAGSVDSANASPEFAPTQRRQGDSWRYVFHNGRWWYWTPANRWFVWRDGRWHRWGDGSYVNVDPSGADVLIYRRDRFRDRDWYGYRWPDGYGYSYYDYYRPRYGRYYRYDPYLYSWYYDRYPGRWYGYRGYRPYGYYYDEGPAIGSIIGGAIGGPRGARLGAFIGALAD